ncbi:Retrovirus-related Pol polyprotein from transposon gypsy [Araneus ventricosus]|uniref:RNA-directed DNA polymerase n=2 Tax=Araneus ventricosus TaxID=182803 RepID=A0A4Y2J7E5_ARAVE|nr:Retrovirus-related Pol polyprotein from transposon gypsy [Araneus ventricosus]
MTETRDKRKTWYDKNAVKREFRVGDLVLVLATSKPNKMAVQWTGPGVIESKLSETNYIVRMEGKKDKTQIYHINLLKPYHQRLERVNLLVNGEENQEREAEELTILYPVSDPNIYDFERIKADSALEGRLSPTEIESLKQLLGRHKKIFSNDPVKTHLVEHDFELISDKPIRSKPYRTSQRQNEILKGEIKRMLDLNIIEIGQSDYASPMILVESTGRDPPSMHRLSSLKCEFPYLDDIAIYSENWEDHLKHVDEVLKRIGNAQQTIKPSKLKFAQNHTKYLGHIVGGGVRSPAEAKIKAVMEFPTPKTKTQIRAFLGLAGYYAHYVKIFSLIAARLTESLKGKIKKEGVNWTQDCNRAFTELKNRLTD